MVHESSAAGPPSFVHLPPFVRDCNRLKFTLDDLRELELEVLEGRADHPVMAGTGGVRKCRFGPPSWRRGKSGGVRVVFADVPEHGLIVLIAVFAKSERGNLSAEERNQLRGLLEQLRRALDHGTL